MTHKKKCYYYKKGKIYTTFLSLFNNTFMYTEKQKQYITLKNST